MKKTISIGAQDFECLRNEDSFYIDKTDFIREWWNSRDIVTLITRPRRFGKTLNLSMLNCFFSDRYAGRTDLFEGLSIWQDEQIRKLQGTFPVIFLTFAGIKGTSYVSTMIQIKKLIVRVFSDFSYLGTAPELTEGERAAFRKVTEEMSDEDAALALNLLCRLAEKHSGKKPLILLDEYDTPLQEAWLGGYWDKLAAFIRILFNNTFKTNASLGRALLTGITRVSKESIFSDLNNLTVVTTTSGRYAACFGFTEDEVFQALDDQGYGDEAKADVKSWYDGFTFGSITEIYNPWSVTNYLKEGRLQTYWANSSGNVLVSHLLQKGSNELKLQFQELLESKSIAVPIDEQIVYNQLNYDTNAVWSLLLATGYLKVLHYQAVGDTRIGEDPLYTLAITNRETLQMFAGMVRNWFVESGSMTSFMKALLSGDEDALDGYMNQIVLTCMSSFDPGSDKTNIPAENFYHGLVLGLLVENASEYAVKSNRESGFGRYDVALEPYDHSKPAVIMEFKVFRPTRGEKTLEDTAANALRQIEEKRYEADLIAVGIPAENIRKYAFAFAGKTCLIRKGN